MKKKRNHYTILLKLIRMNTPKSAKKSYLKHRIMLRFSPEMRDSTILYYSDMYIYIHECLTNKNQRTRPILSFL